MPRPKGLPKTGGRKKGSLPGFKLRKEAQKLEAVKVTVDRVLEEYGRIAFLDMSEAFDADGRLKPIHEMTEDVRRALAGIEVAQLNVDNDGKGPVGHIHKIKILDKVKALDSIGKHLGMFIDKVQMSGTLTMETAAEALRAARLARMPK